MRRYEDQESDCSNCVHCGCGSDDEGLCSYAGHVYHKEEDENGERFLEWPMVRAGFFCSAWTEIKEDA